MAWSPFLGFGKLKFAKQDLFSSLALRQIVPALTDLGDLRVVVKLNLCATLRAQPTAGLANTGICNRCYMWEGNMRLSAANASPVPPARQAVSEKMVVVLRKVKAEKSADWLGGESSPVGSSPKKRWGKSQIRCQLPVISNQ
jgi:hypothetical protein